jgi:hypothetical protein
LNHGPFDLVTCIPIPRAAEQLTLGAVEMTKTKALRSPGVNHDSLMSINGIANNRNDVNWANEAFGVVEFSHS